MADESQDIREAIAEAVSGSEYAKSLQEQMDDIGTPSDAPAAEGEQFAKDDGPNDEGAPETSVEAGTGEEPPTEYWGTSLEGLSAEQRAEVIAALEQRDSVIQQLQQKLAKEPEFPAPVDETPEEITDEDILRALGVNMDDPMEVEYATKFTLPLARQQVQLEETVEKLSTTAQAQEAASFWNVEIDKLEAEHGKLPGDRTQVLNFAVSEGITHPEILYWRVAAPGRKAVDAEVAKIRRSTAQKVATGQLRPSNTGTGSKVIDTSKMTLKETIKAAALQAQEETGVKWSSVAAGQSAVE
jgi:hypothetical protein